MEREKRKHPLKVDISKQGTGTADYTYKLLQTKVTSLKVKKTIPVQACLYPHFAGMAANGEGLEHLPHQILFPSH